MNVDEILQVKADPEAQRQLVATVLQTPLAYDTLGNGAPALTVDRLTELTAVPAARVQEILHEFVHDGILDLEVHGHALRVEMRDGCPVAIRGAV